ncbi:hypothetical protein M405DRAFT_870476 [Rhizopogon salebrosus TDB-379]|nr:hypothetical protein M405DRAFT_870476 [Rhizopogon salebrosus TDB-379]
MSRFTLKGFSRKQINIPAQGPVHFLAYNESRHYLAIAIGHEVLVRRETRDGIGFVRLPEPEAELCDYESTKDRKLRPRGIHFHNAGTELIVAYLNHGVTCYDLDTLGMTWQILPKPDGLRIGSSAISADAEALLLHNIQEGLYMYRIGQTRPSRVFTIDDAANNKYALPVLFLHHNTAVVSGAEDGKVRIRQTTGEEFQTLYHDNDIIQALACFQGRENHNYIATGTTRKGQKTYIRIWRAAITSSEPQSEFGSVVNTIVVRAMQPGHMFSLSSYMYIPSHTVLP